MILERLKEFAERVGDELPPSGYTKMKIRWIIELNNDGRLLGVTKTEQDNKRKYIERLAPSPDFSGKRTAVKSGLLADTAEYVIAKQAEKKTGKSDKSADKHKEFIDAVKRCVEEVKLPTVLAVATFLKRENLANDSTFKEVEAGDWMTFSVNGSFPVDLPEVRRYWVRSQMSSPKRGICMVCGTPDVLLVERQPVPLKGVPGGQTSGVQLVSANDPPYESYGLQASFVAPMCFSCAEEAHQALNYLIEKDQHHFRLSDKLIYVFWTREAASEFDVARLISEASEDDVKKLYTSVYKGKGEIAQVVPEDQFYALALSGSGGRAVVRDWIEASLPQTQRNLMNYFAAQHIAGGQHPYVNLFALAAATVRELKEIAPWVPLAIVQHALRGDPLPLSLLTTTVRRCGIGKTFGESRRHADHAQAALIKLCLISWRAQSGQKTSEDWMIKLDLNCEEPAYLYGRLFSTLERIQEAASGVNNVERTFGTAFMSPASTLPRLVARAKQAHIPKLRRDTPGLGVNLEKQLNEIHGKLSTNQAFLKKLDPEGQGMFVLGYYHQNAARWEKSADESKEQSTN